MKKIIKLNERDLTLIVKKVLSEQSKPAQQSIPAAAYEKMIGGAVGMGTNTNKIISGLNSLTTADEFYQLNNLFKDGKTGYKSFDEMIKGEFELGVPLGLGMNTGDMKKVLAKLESLNVPYDLGKYKLFKDFKVLPKPAPAAPATQTKEGVKPNWDKVKNYLLTKGLPPDYPNKGETSQGYEYVVIKNDKYMVDFWGNGKVYIQYNILNTSRNIVKTWSWDGSKPVVEGGINTPEVTKKASGYATTEDEITSGTKILGLGSQGDLVKRVQYEIFFWSDGKMNPGCKTDSTGPKDCDGIYGKLTKKYVLEFQKDENLRGKDGNVGRETWAFMNPYGMDEGT